MGYDSEYPRKAVGYCRVSREEQARDGGWRSINTMKRVYQQADDAGVLDAVLDPRRLRESKA